MNTIRVCMVSYSLPPHYSGAGSQALRLAQKLADKGCAVSALTSRHQVDLPARDSLMGIPVYRLPVIRTRRLRPLSFSLFAAWHLLWHYQRYDIVHCHGAYWRILPILLIARLTGRKSVVKMTQLGTDDPQTIRGRRFGRVLYRIFTLTDAVVSTSLELSTRYRNSSLPQGKLVQIPNGVDIDLFRPADDTLRIERRTQHNLPRDALVIVFVGQVGHRKGTDLLLQAWKMVISQIQDAWLVLVGPIGEDLPLPEDEAPVEHWLSKASQTLALGHQVNVQDYLQASDVFVLPTRMEGLPNALMEAMAVGLPCIASDIGGNVDLIADGENGLLFEAGNIEQLADVLLQLMDNETMRRKLGRRARETIETNYSFSQITEKYLDLYHRLLEKYN